MINKYKPWMKAMVSIITKDLSKKNMLRSPLNKHKVNIQILHIHRHNDTYVCECINMYDVCSL